MKLKRMFARDNGVSIISKHINENGYLVLECTFARTGIQERYGAEISAEFEALRLYREYRSPEEVFKPEVLSAFQSVVITNDHPKEMLDASNTKYHAIGFVSSDIEIIEGAYLGCKITIFDQDTIEDIQNGKVELSAGYGYSISMTEGEDYDYIQTDIKPNHISIVQAGRCGSACSIALDSTPNKGQHMKIVFKRQMPDGSDEVIAEIEVSDASAETVQGLADMLYEQSKELVSGAKALDEGMSALKEEIVSKDEEISSLKDDNSKLQAELDTKPEAVATDAQIMPLALDMASVFMISDKIGLDREGKSVCDLKREAILKVNPTINLEGKDQAYIGYAFDTVSEQVKSADASFLKALDFRPDKALDEKSKQSDEAKAGFDQKFGGNR